MLQVVLRAQAAALVAMAQRLTISQHPVGGAVRVLPAQLGEREEQVVFLVVVVGEVARAPM